MTLSASRNRTSYITTTTIIKKYLQNTHLSVMLCCWDQNVQALEVLTSGRNGCRLATSRFFWCLFSTECAWGHESTADHFWWWVYCPKRINYLNRADHRTVVYKRQKLYINVLPKWVFSNFNYSPGTWLLIFIGVYSEWFFTTSLSLIYCHS